jgi:hypothetical protein
MICATIPLQTDFEKRAITDLKQVTRREFRKYPDVSGSPEKAEPGHILLFHTWRLIPREQH